MKVPYTKSGRCGDVVWQRNRYGQICYPAFIPFNPRTPLQVAVRGSFAAVSARWRTLTQQQRDVWIAVAWTQWSKPRLSQRGRLTGCQLFVKVNVSLVNQGKPQVDLPPEHLRSPKRTGSSTPVANVAMVSRLHWPRTPGSRAIRSVDSESREGGFVPKRDTGRGWSPLRYRSLTVVPPYSHRSTALAGRSRHWRPQNRLSFPCRSQPPRLRSPMRAVCRAPPSAATS
jgi:hypothetical protein